MAKKRKYQLQDEYVAIPFRDVVAVNLVDVVVEERCRMGASHVYARSDVFERLILPFFRNADWQVELVEKPDTQNKIVRAKLGDAVADFIRNPVKNGDIVVWVGRHDQAYKYGIIGNDDGSLKIYYGRNNHYSNTLGITSYFQRRAAPGELTDEQIAEMKTWIPENAGLLDIEIQTRNPDQGFLRRMYATRAERIEKHDGLIAFRLKMTHQAFKMLRARCIGRRYGRKHRYAQGNIANQYEGDYALNRL